VNKLTLAVGSAVLLASCATAPEPAPQPAPAPAPVSLPVPPPAQRQAAAPAPAPVAAPVPKRCDATVTLQNEEVFAFTKSELTPAAKARLDRDVIAKLVTCSQVEAVVIEGHTDRMGSHKYNQKLPKARRERQGPPRQQGTDSDKIETLGIGQDRSGEVLSRYQGRSELIACLAPNRRAIVSIKGPGR